MVCNVPDIVRRGPPKQMFLSFIKCCCHDSSFDNVCQIFVIYKIVLSMIQ